MLASSTTVVNDVCKDCDVHTDWKSGDDVKVKEEAERVVFYSKTHEYLQRKSNEEEEIDIINGYIILVCDKNGPEIFHKQRADSQEGDEDLKRNALKQLLYFGADQGFAFGEGLHFGFDNWIFEFGIEIGAVGDYVLRAKSRYRF